MPAGQLSVRTMASWLLLCALPSGSIVPFVLVCCITSLTEMCGSGPWSAEYCGSVKGVWIFRWRKVAGATSWNLDTLYDDDAIKREIRSMFTRANILVRRFGKCSLAVKHILFKMYLFVYMMLVFGLDIRLALIISYGHATISHKCIKLFFGYKRYD